MGLKCVVHESIRTTIGKITDSKSDSATKTLTDLEKYLKEKFSFLGITSSVSLLESP